MSLIEEEKREDAMFRIIRCCGNCFYGSYYKGKQRRLVCLHGINPDPRGWGGNPNARKPQGHEKFYKKNMYDKFPVTHITAVCDNHKWGKKSNTKKVTDWCGAEPMEDY